MAALLVVAVPVEVDDDWGAGFEVTAHEIETAEAEVVADRLVVERLRLKIAGRVREDGQRDDAR